VAGDEDGTERVEASLGKGVVRRDGGVLVLVMKREPRLRCCKGTTVRVGGRMDSYGGQDVECFEIVALH
jgi:hypothetical protein